MCLQRVRDSTDPETNIGICAMVSVYRRAGVEVHSGQNNCLYRNLGEPKCSNEASDRAEEGMKRYVISVVGLIHGRGVVGVMPSESI